MRVWVASPFFDAAMHRNMRDDGLNGTIPSSVGQLTALTYLGLGGNVLTGALPDTVGQLTMLTFL